MAGQDNDVDSIRVTDPPSSLRHPWPAHAGRGPVWAAGPVQCAPAHSGLHGKARVAAQHAVSTCVLSLQELPAKGLNHMSTAGPALALCTYSTRSAATDKQLTAAAFRTK
jgi:hypothetical protein